MSYASAVGKTLLNKEVSLYLSDPCMKNQYFDYESNQNSTVTGTLTYADDDLFIVETEVRGQKIPAYINGYYVIGLIPQTPGISVDIVFFETAKSRKR